MRLAEYGFVDCKDDGVSSDGEDCARVFQSGLCATAIQASAVENRFGASDIR